jgi:CRP-like cAMP-binding protein
MLEQLSRVPMLTHLPADALNRLFELGRERKFAVGKPLMRQGEPSAHLFILLSGRVRVERLEADSLSPTVLAELGPDEVVGEMGVLEQVPRSATVIAVEETRALQLGLPALAVTMVQYPQLAATFLRMLSGRLRSTSAQASGHSTAAALAPQREHDWEQGRLEGAQLMARTIEHLVKQQLTLLVGYSELVAMDARLPAELRVWADQVTTAGWSVVDLIQTSSQIEWIRAYQEMGMDLLDLEPLLKSRGSRRARGRRNPAVPGAE